MNPLRFQKDRDHLPWTQKLVKALWSFDAFSLNDVLAHAAFVLITLPSAAWQDSKARKATGPGRAAGVRSRLPH